MTEPVSRYRKVMLALGAEPRTRAELLWILPNTGRVVDFKIRGWGHSISGNAVWCTPPLQSGDRIVTELGRFACYDVEPQFDPADMVFAKFVQEEPEGMERSK